MTFMSIGPEIFHSKESKQIYNRNNENKKNYGSRSMPHEFSDEESNDDEIDDTSVNLNDQIK